MIVIAGATGNLGGKIVEALLKKGAEVKAIVSNEMKDEKILLLKNKKLTVVKVDMQIVAEIADACKGASCVASALAGLKDIVIETQIKLMEGAVLAKVPRFIPSDYCTDFTKLLPGNNRNLGTRRTFNQY